jgi:hypothetical protein
LLFTVYDPLFTIHGSTVHGTRDAVFAATLIVDDFEGGEIQNHLGGRANVYVKAPSRIMMSRREEMIQGKKTHVLLLRYDKKAEGGPYGMGGWCGYYTLLKTSGHLVAPTEEEPNPSPVGEQYLEGSGFKAVSFLVRGERGDENFAMGLADRHWDRVGDSVKSEEIGKYLPAGRLTTDWQKATIPTDVFFVDYSKLASISICFEGDLYPEGSGTGTVYIDDITLE